MYSLARSGGAAALGFAAAVLLSSIPAVAEQSPAPGGKSAPPPRSQGALVNINTAGAAELETLPGIGPKIAAEVVRYREQSGRFKRIEDILNVKGIGEKTFLLFKDRITVGEPAAKN